MRVPPALFACLLVLSACAAGPSLGGEYAYRQAYETQAQVVADERDCKVDARCGDYLFLNCRIEADGPGYYIHEPTGQVIEVCGGACMAPSPDVCVHCPPPEWTCPP